MTTITCKCIEKFRDKSNNIKGYRLQDNDGNCITVSSEQLKLAIFSKQLDVINLKLTKDGKLIDLKSDSAISEKEKELLSLFKKMVYAKNLSAMGRIRLVQLMNETYNLNMEVIGYNYYTEDKREDELEISSGNLFMNVSSTSFLIYNYQISKYRGAVINEIPDEVSNFTKEAIELGYIKDITIESIRNLASFLKENECKLTYKILVTKTIDYLNNMIKLIEKHRIFKDKLQLRYEFDGCVIFEIKDTKRNTLIGLYIGTDTDGKNIGYNLNFITTDEDKRDVTISRDMSPAEFEVMLVKEINRAVSKKLDYLTKN